jgi:hypothetical protein
MFDPKIRFSQTSGTGYHTFALNLRSSAMDQENRIALNGEILLMTKEGRRSMTRQTAAVPAFKSRIFHRSRFTGTTGT